MILVCAPDRARGLVDALHLAGEPAWRIGEVS
jgi:hypothetical protein